MNHVTAPASSKRVDFSQVLVEGAQEVFGVDGLRSVLHLMPCSDEALPVALFALPAVLEKTYGVAGARGLALRIGRSMFKYILKHLGQEYSLTSVDFRLLPAQRRIPRGLHILAEIFFAQFGDTITISEEETCWVWQSAGGLLNADRKSDSPSCYMIVGLLQEYLAWASGGRFYRVIEATCCAASAQACVFRIDRRPVE